MKIGFVDYYLNEFHSNRYVGWLKEEDPSLEVAYGYGMIPCPRDGMTNENWCEQYGVLHCKTIEEVVEKSDALVVLSPDNCEMHEELCRLPLASGKPCYIDKTFAPDLETARRIFAVADAHNTSCYSTSALRFCAEYEGIDRNEITSIATWGPNDFNIYSIHQLEPIVMMMGCNCEKVMYVGGENTYSVHMIFADGRPAVMTSFIGGSPFITNIATKTTTHTKQIVAGAYWKPFIHSLAEFFKTGDEPVARIETLRIMAIRTAVLEAMKTSGVWTKVEQV